MRLSAPAISDAEYDQLFDELKELEEQTSFILSNSPTQTVGYHPVSELPKLCIRFHCFLWIEDSIPTSRLLSALAVVPKPEPTAAGPALSAIWFPWIFQ